MTAADVLAAPRIRALGDQVPAVLTWPAVRLFLARLEAEEGAISNEKADRGGFTKYGLTAALLADFDLPRTPDAIAGYRLEAARVVYAAFLVRYRLQALAVAPRLFLAVADYAVNSGAGAAIRALQRAAGVEPDAVLGPRTLAAVLEQSAGDLDLLLDKLTAERLELLGLALRRPDQARFALGWLRRVGRVLTWRPELED